MTHTVQERSDFVGRSDKKAHTLQERSDKILNDTHCSGACFVERSDKKAHTVQEAGGRKAGWPEAAVHELKA